MTGTQGDTPPPRRLPWGCAAAWAVLALVGPAWADDTTGVPAAPPAATPTVTAMVDAATTPTLTLDGRPAPTPERLYLQRLRDEFGRVQTARATFHQRRYSNVFLEEQKHDGEFHVQKPGKFHIAYKGSDNSETLYVDETAYMYLPEFKQVERHTIARGTNPYETLNLSLLGFDVDVDNVFAVYRIALGEPSAADGGTSRTLTFEPLRPQETNLVELRLSVHDAGAAVADDDMGTPASRPSLVPTHLFTREASGDTAELVIDALDINIDLDPTLFVPSYPDDVEIIESP